MAEYIERGALRKRLEDFSEWCRDGRKEGVDFVLDRPLPNTPAADVVEVVRCKDCKYAKVYNDIIGEPHLFCCNGKSIYRRKVDFDDFCSNGERKEV